MATKNPHPFNTQEITIDGTTLTLKEWASASDLTYQTIYGRLRTGWDTKRALTTPTGDPSATRQPVPYTYKGRTKSLSIHAREHGLSYQVAYGRLQNGWSLERALTTPYRGTINAKSCAKLTHEGVTKTLSEWANTPGVEASAPSMRYRIKMGYSSKDVLYAEPNSFKKGRSTKTYAKLTHNGETRTILEWAHALNIPMSVIYSRRAAGWSTERMLTEPVRNISKDD